MGTHAYACRSVSCPGFTTVSERQHPARLHPSSQKHTPLPSSAHILEYGDPNAHQNRTNRTSIKVLLSESRKGTGHTPESPVRCSDSQQLQGLPPPPQWSPNLFVEDAKRIIGQRWANLRDSLKLHPKQDRFAMSSPFRPKDGITGENSLPLLYDPDAIADYFRLRPFLVASRASLIMAQCSFLGTCILMDILLKKVEQNAEKRAAHLLHLITHFGPTAIKLGQAMSVRSDILPPAYIEALQKLQDQVPPFSTEEARELILKELGRDADQMFSEISDKPIAAASLGQVYKAKLKDSGEFVAVKVQRPGLLESISLDLHILRSLLRGYHNVSNQYPELVSILDHWATHFFHELDYVREANNAEVFRRGMRSLANVVVPKAYMELSSPKVLTSSWIEGVKLSESEAGDVSNLVSTALNCYLIQLLETGFLHADPHPGNLLRTSEGRLCVLDFGLMLEVTEEQRYALVDYILHLINADYENAVDDLITLGFVPLELSNREKAEAILPQFSRVLSQLVRGGGLKKLNVEEIVDDLAGMANEHGITVPPFFALLFRTYSILEGIGLKSNPDYAIIRECYPYICKRLLTDENPRTRKALKYFLYGKKVQVDAHRVESMMYGLQNFCTTMMPIQAKRSSKFASLPVDPTSKQVLFSLFAPEGSFLQELLLTELVRIVDALSRAAAFELLKGFAGASPFSRLLPPFSWAWTFSNFFGSNNVPMLSDEDQEALKLVRRLWELAGPQISHQTVADMTGAAHSFGILVPDLATGVSTASMRFMVMLLHRKAVRLADDLDGRNQLTLWNQDPVAWARHVRPLSLLPINSSKST